MQLLDEPFRHNYIFDNLSFPQFRFEFLEQKIFLQILVDILPFDPDSWIRIFLRIRIQNQKCCGSNGYGSRKVLFSLFHRD